MVNVTAIQPNAWEQHPLSLAPLVPAVFTVSRSGLTGHALYVAYAIEGTAENGVDYQLLSGEIIIPEGESSAYIFVVAIDDLIHEPTETVEIELLPLPCIAIFPPPPECYAVGPDYRAEAFIVDNDPGNLPPRVEITSPAQGATFTEPAEIQFAVNTVDPDGWVPVETLTAGEEGLHYVDAFTDGISTKCYRFVPIPLDPMAIDD